MIWLLPAVFLITTLMINQRLSQRLPLAETGSVNRVSGVIGSLPEFNGEVLSFIFLPDNNEIPLPQKIMVYWYKDRNRTAGNARDLPQLRAGEHWQLMLRLRSPRGRVNFYGTDSERWYFTEGIDALATVQRGENIRLADPRWFDLQHWREVVLERLTEKAGAVPAFRILAALAIADRRGLRVDDRGVLAATGTGHLLAISGLHIGLAASLGFYLGRLLLLPLPHVSHQRMAALLPVVTMWLSAFMYSALSGFGVSTQRALIMLSVATVVLLRRKYVHPFLALMVAMALVLAADPIAPLRAGFWFSFIAVAVLLMLFVPRHGYIPVWRRMLLAQLGITLVMAPMGMYWFQQASLPGLLANLVAIPIVSMWVVPLLLTALILMWLPGPLATWLLMLAGHSAYWLFEFLDYLSALQPSVLSSTRTPGLLATVLAMLGAVILLLPRGTPSRYTGLLLMLPLMFPAGKPADKTGIQLDFMDVGQGLSVLIADQDYLMLYDTGPGNGLAGETGWDMVGGTLQPMIRASGGSPDLVVASHADLDHAGGLQRLGGLYPNARYLASLPSERQAVGPCRAPDAWMSNQLKFRVLHPSPGLPYLGNDSSCVISVKGSLLSVLLSGDISRVVEKRLVDNGLDEHAILTSPHHGSSTSSSQLLIDAVQPSLVLISTSIKNRFGFPRADVLSRYSKSNIPFLNTADCGGIRIKTDLQGGFVLESARVNRKTIWRWPASAVCP